MIAKCNLCGNTFNAVRSTAKFCCDLHRTLFGKLSAEEKAEKLKQLDTSLKTASEIPKTEKEQTKNSYTWVDEIEKFCNEQGITPKDLILSYKERFKAIKSKKGANTSNSEEKPKMNAKNETNVSYFLSDLRKKKCGL